MSFVDKKPVFDPRKSDEYMKPIKYEFVSYLFERNVEEGVDVYRTGILLDKDHIIFYSGPLKKDDPDSGNSITFGPFCFGKTFFRSNHFRVRRDLMVDR